MALARKHVSQELSQQKKNDSEVNHPDPNFLARKLKASEVSSYQINPQHTAHQITTRKHRNFPGCSRWPPINEEAPEIFILCFEKPHIDLRDGSGEDENQPQPEAKDGEPQRGEEFYQPLEKGIGSADRGVGGWSVLRAACCVRGGFVGRLAGCGRDGGGGK